MINFIKEKCRLTQTKFSFGATSAIITNLGLITGLDKLAHPQLSIITGILIIAVADNIADSAGIHIYQESECLGSKEVWFSTLSNFLTRILVSLAFIFLIVRAFMNDSNGHNLTLCHVKVLFVIWPHLSTID